MNVKVELLAHTPEPEKLVAAAAKMCYSNAGVQGVMEQLTPEKTQKFLEMLMSMGHESPLEHVSFTFGLEGVSRSLLAQLTRHRIASYSVKSQRYVNEGTFEYITPPEIAKDPETLALYHKTMEDINAAYARLTESLRAVHEKTMAPSAAEKKAIEDARYVLPNACETKLIVTMNIRSLYNFFAHRCCERAQWEIRAVADQMLEQVKAVAPTLFSKAGPPCVKGPCPEGKMSCGKMLEKREKYLKG